jgi:hypothetical protein
VRDSALSCQTQCDRESAKTTKEDAKKTQAYLSYSSRSSRLRGHIPEFLNRLIAHGYLVQLQRQPNVIGEKRKSLSGHFIHTHQHPAIKPFGSRIIRADDRNVMKAIKLHGAPRLAG